MAIVKQTDLRLKHIPDELCKTQSIYINVGELNFSNNDFEEIPETIQLFSTMKKVSFSNNQLKTLNDYLFILTDLESVCFNQNKLESLPKSIESLVKLTSLDVCANKLHTFGLTLPIKRLDLSANFFTTITLGATNLTFLDLSQNDLKEFPVLECPKLRQINASYNNIQGLPDQITLLSSLRNLDLKNNEITQLPLNFSLLTALTQLQLENNPISGVPPNFNTMRIKKLNVTATKNFLFEPIAELKELVYSKVNADILFDDYTPLKNLDTLDISNNRFKVLTATSTNLVTLNVSYNLISTLTLTPNCTVQKVFARHNCITAIDQTIFNNQKIAILDMSNNELQTLPMKMEMARLQHFNVGFNKLNHIDIDFLKVLTLTHLDISFNKIVTLPTQIGTLSNLKSLHITGNNIATLPLEFSQLISLTKLHASDNKFTTFPSVLLTLSTLAKLYISSNHFEELPMLSTLMNLQTFDASNCFITSGKSVINLIKLEQLNLSNNYISEPPTLTGCTALVYVDISYNSLQKCFDASQFKKIHMLDVSFNDLTEVPKHSDTTVVRYDGNTALHRFPFLPRFNNGLKFGSVPITCAGAQMCADRDEMQDAFICIPHFAAPEHFLLVAIDGHNGCYVPYMFSNRFPQIFYDMLSRDGGSLGIKEALYQSFDALQNEFAGDSKAVDGAVATVVFMTPTQIYTAQCGDCRAVYITSGGIIQLAPEHKTSDRKEQIRIRSEGGFVDNSMRVCGLLVARSVGDVKSKPILTHIPDITVIDRKADEEYLVVATDGVWDEVSNQKIHNILHSNRRVFRTSELVGLLKDTAYVSCVSTQIPDNIGIVLARF
ncbi:leucine-rich repeat containing protein, putative [Entamoeba invadens IP1]|uniref:Leucine-rich repeat containing protein, putative n=1 Tax=Entamoeba invadens IP1 TaxID=370355 RepID=A0A0A1U5T1_ENTIV|nr:leucine-rich repeat containing protein, putative [Entamoeba invadens IP1]ELP89748.1 leucine-rich repeat containing protein, putative [Entamoeba invadens IP1]|eukprot:XP_004256519.1 leucine-rich repeat containing protein, putative [Entamoeba invadens IP1]